MDHPIDQNCITNQELVDWLKLIERNVPNADHSMYAALAEPSDPPSYSRATLAIVATIAGCLTFAWTAFLLWMVLKALSLV